MSEQDMVRIESQVRHLKKSIFHVITSEKCGNSKKLFELVAFMADILIKLNEIDTTGVKSMKIKKNFCISELKNMKAALIQSIQDNDSSADDSPIEAKQEEDLSTEDEVAEVPMVPGPSHLLSVQEEFFINVNPSVTHMNLPQCSKENDEDVWQMASVQKLAQLFESKTSPGEPSPKKAATYTSHVNTSSEMPIDWSSEFRRLEVAVHNLDDTAGLDEIEDLKEKTIEGLGFVRGQPELQKRGDTVLKHLKMLEILKNAENKNNLLRASQSKLQDSDANQNGNTTSALPAGEQLYASEQYVKNSNAHLAHTVARLDFYKSLINGYLDKTPFSDVLSEEDEIEQHFKEFTEFVPHESMKSAYSEIDFSFKELRNLLVENQFTNLYNSNFNEIRGELCSLDVKLNGYQASLENLDVDKERDKVATIQTEFASTRETIIQLCERLEGDPCIEGIKNSLLNKICAVNNLIAVKLHKEG